MDPIGKFDWCCRKLRVVFQNVFQDIFSEKFRRNRLAFTIFNAYLLGGALVAILTAVNDKTDKTTSFQSISIFFPLIQVVNYIQTYTIFKNKSIDFI